MYRIANRHASRRRRARIGASLVVVLVIVATLGIIHFLRSLHTTTVVSNSKPVVTQVSYQGKVKHYNEGDFNIDIPAEWIAEPRPPYTYQSYTWHSSDKGDAIDIEIYEDTIPTNFAVNRALIVSGEGDHLGLTGQASDNCEKFTAPTSSAQSGFGVPAKWQNVDFLCNRVTTTRDVIGTSSTDGVNTVVLKSPTGVTHKFFFTYSDNQLSPDYSAFYNALATFSMN